VIDELSSLGTERITLMGGEPLRYAGWEQLAKRGIAHGMDMDMVTSAVGLDDAVAHRIAAVPLNSVTISVDGTEAVHDHQRRVEGSYRRAIQAVRSLDALGVLVGVTTQINALSLPVLETMAPELEAAGVVPT
jgi:MoaA/NifB/PqqE/SkfB family radical SAM enzyme